MATIAEALAAALGHQMAGRLNEAAILYGRILAAVPDQPDALHLSGVLAAQTGAPERGIGPIRAALALEPDKADYWSNLGNLLRLLDRKAEAASGYRRAMTLRPGFGEAGLALTHLLLDLGQLGALAGLFAAGGALADGVGSTAPARLALARAFAARNRAEDAAPQWAVALLLDPAAGEALLHHANHRLDRGRTGDAARWYGRALAARPGHVETAFNLGIALRDRLPGAGPAPCGPKGWDEVAAAFAVAIAAAAAAGTPVPPRAVTEQADALRRGGRIDRARAVLAAALARDPADGEAMTALGALRKAHGARAGEAAALPTILRAARLCPDRTAARIDAAILLHQAGGVAEAIAHYRAALALEPALADGWTNLCVALTDRHEMDSAAHAGRRALRLEPGEARHRINAGNAALAAERLEEAGGAYRSAAALAPAEADPYLNLGTVAQRRHGPLAALPFHRRALVLLPDYAEARVNHAFALLLAGRFREGWAEHEWRWRQARFTSPRRPFRQPQWSGEPLDGRVVLLHGEQGFGDTVQFLRYADAVAARDGRVVLEVPRPLLRLCVESGLDRSMALVANGDPLPPFDLHCPLMSLPPALGLPDPADAPAAPYLSAAPREVALWRERLPGSADRRIGLVWAGNPEHANDRNRSMPPDALAPLLALPGFRFVSLQMGPARRAAPPGVFDAMDGVRDFADSAALLGALDLLIAVDTAPVHLAGALGVPAWVLLPHAPDWRWRTDRADTPWYPSLRLFRQPAPGDWGAVVASVREALRDGP